MEPMAFVLVGHATRGLVLSARPDAPVVPERPPRVLLGPGLRRSTAGALRRLADRLEPRRSPAPAR